jgi:hypothetical protein
MLTHNLASSPLWFPTYKSPPGSPDEGVYERNQKKVEDAADSDAGVTNEVGTIYLYLVTI